MLLTERLAATLVLAVAIACPALSAYPDATLDKPGTLAHEIAAARRAGLPTKPADLRMPMPPPARNAATYYRRLLALRKEKPPTGSTGEVEQLAGRMKLSPSELAKVRVALSARREDVLLIRRAASCERCNFNRNWSDWPNVVFLEFAPMRSAVRWLSLKAAVQVADGRPLDAVSTMAMGYRIANHAASDPNLIGYLVAVAVDAISDNSMAGILYATGGAPDIARSVAREVRFRRADHGLTYALRGELATDVIFIDLARRDGPKALQALAGTSPSDFEGSHLPRAGSPDWKTFVDANGAYVVRYMRQVVAASLLPLSGQRAAISRMEADLQRRTKAHDTTVMLATIVVPAYGMAGITVARTAARSVCLRAGCAVLLWHAAHHAWPQRLRQCMPRVPADPFDGKPLRYRREGDGFVIYSVGETGHFDGGKPDAKPKPTESLFRWPKPAYWDQRSLPRR